MYAGEAPPVGLGKFLEQKIGDIVERKLAAMRGETADFDIGDAVRRLNNPARASAIAHARRNGELGLPEDLIAHRIKIYRRHNLYRI